jgi:hypothetical protein
MTVGMQMATETIQEGLLEKRAQPRHHAGFG